MHNHYMIITWSIKEIENNTWSRGDMEFIFECSHRYRTSERSERVRYRMWTLEDEFHISKRPCIILFYYINLLTTAFLTIFRRFPATLRRLPRIFQNCSEGQTNVPEHFPWISENSRRCAKISEDSLRLSRKIRRCFDDTPTNLSTIKETKLISEKSSISSHVKLS